MLVGASRPLGDAPDRAEIPPVPDLAVALKDYRGSDAVVQGESRLGKQQAKLDKAAQKAKERKEAAEAECASGDAKAAGKQLKKVVRKLIQFSHRLRSNNARNRASLSRKAVRSLLSGAGACLSRL